MKNVLIFETSLAGHRGYYVSVLARALLQRNANVSIAIPPGGLETAEGKTNLSDIASSVQLIELGVQADGSLVNQAARQRFEMLVETVKKVRPEHVYVPYADGISQWWGRQFKPGSVFDKNLVIEGLMMRGAYAYPLTSYREKIYHRLNYWAVKRSCWSRLHHLDPLVVEYFRQRPSAFEQRLFQLPEATEPLCVTDRVKAAEVLGVDPEQTLITCPGMVDERKGWHRLLYAFAQLRTPQMQLILLGKHSEQIRSLLKNEYAELVAAGAIKTEDRFASNEEFDALFAVADLVCALYPRHIGSSSILIRAARAQKPILASNWGWNGWASREYDLAQTCDVSNDRELVDAMRVCLETGNELVTSEKRQQFVEYHSLENHIRHWMALFDSQ